MDVRDNKQLWGDQYSRKVSDLLAVQRDIAQEITANLRPRISGTEGTRAKQYTQNSEAYQLYLKGRYTGTSLLRTITEKPRIISNRRLIKTRPMRLLT